MPLELLVLLDSEELAPFGVVLDYWVEELRLGDTLAVEVVVTGGKLHLGLAKEEQEEPVLAIPFGCREMAHEGRELLDEVSHRVEGSLPHNCVDHVVFHTPSHHLGDGGQGCSDLHHICTVRALKMNNLIIRKKCHVLRSTPCKNISNEFQI